MVHLHRLIFFISLILILILIFIFIFIILFHVIGYHQHWKRCFLNSLQFW